MSGSLLLPHGSTERSEDFGRSMCMRVYLSVCLLITVFLHGVDKPGGREASWEAAAPTQVRIDTGVNSDNGRGPRAVWSK
jgi:hypothetical protein